MKSIENRIKKLEATILPSSDQDDVISGMTPEERQHRIAQLIYKGLCDTDPKVMAMTEEEFITLYLSSNPKERDTLCGYDFKEGSAEDQLLNRLRAQMQCEERR